MRNAVNHIWFLFLYLFYTGFHNQATFKRTWNPSWNMQCTNIISNESHDSCHGCIGSALPWQSRGFPLENTKFCWKVFNEWVLTETVWAQESIKSKFSCTLKYFHIKSLLGGEMGICQYSFSVVFPGCHCWNENLPQSCLQTFYCWSIHYDLVFMIIRPCIILTVRLC